MNNRIAKKMITAAAFVAIAVLAVAAGGAEAQEICVTVDACYESGIDVGDFNASRTAWAATGATASVDEGSQNAYALRGTEAYVRSNRTGTVIYRYPVRCDGDIRMQARYFSIRYKDDGSQSRVQAKLISTDLLEGGENVIHEFDSDLHSSRSSYQTYVAMLDQEQENDGTGYTYYGRYNDWGLLCDGKAYHVEVRLTRRNGGDPRLQMLAINR